MGCEDWDRPVDIERSQRSPWSVIAVQSDPPNEPGADVFPSLARFVGLSPAGGILATVGGNGIRICGSPPGDSPLGD